MSTKAKLGLWVSACIAIAGGALWLIAGGSGQARPDVSPGQQQATLAAEDSERVVRAADAISTVEPAARAPVDTDRTGTLSLQVVYADRGDPAGGAGVTVLPWGDPHPRARSFRAHTDADGHASLEGLHDGSVVIYGDRGGFVRVQVEPGGHRSATLTIPVGIDVEGEVVDGDGRPVGGAEIWLSDHGNFQNGGPVCFADAGGRFWLRSVSTQHAVMARKVGYAPSSGVWIQGSNGDTRPVRLVLPGRGALVRVAVVDASREPVVGARVRIASEGPRPTERRTDGMIDVEPVDYVLTTDADGGCIAESVAPGAVKVMVNAIGYAPWEVQRELAAGETELRAQLTRGASVAGRVTLVTGEPLGGATVRIGGYADDDTREARTGPDGRYRIDGVGVGPLSILAWSRDHGKSRGELVGAEGALAEWNATLDPGLVLQGRVVDEVGRGLAGWMVNVRGPDDSSRFWGQAITDADGRYRVIDCPATPLFIQLIDRTQDVVFPVAESGPHRAGGEPVELRVLDRERMTAQVSGRVLTADGEPIAAQVVISPPGPPDPLDDMTRSSPMSHEVWSDHDTGRFRIGPLAPGHYVIAVRSEHGDAQSGEFELGANEQRDLGDLTLGGPGKLQIALRVPDGVPPREVWITVSPQNRQANPFQLSVNGAQLAEDYDVPVGAFVVQVSGSVVWERHLLTVAAGEPQRLELAPRTGVWVALAVQANDGGDRDSRFRLRVVTPAGEQVAERVGRLGENRRPIRVVVPPADSYRVVVETRDGRHGEAWLGRGAQWLGPRSGVQPPAPVEVVLR